MAMRTNVLSRVAIDSDSNHIALLDSVVHDIVIAVLVVVIVVEAGAVFLWEHDIGCREHDAAMIDKGNNVMETIMR